MSSVFSQMMNFSFVGNSQKVREGTCVIHCMPRSPAKPIREARHHSHRRSHFAKPLRGWSVLCAIMASVLCAFMAVACQRLMFRVRRLRQDYRKMTGRRPEEHGPVVRETMERFREASAKPPRSHRGPTSTLRPSGPAVSPSPEACFLRSSSPPLAWT